MISILRKHVLGSEGVRSVIDPQEQCWKMRIKAFSNVRLSDTEKTGAHGYPLHLFHYSNKSQKEGEQEDYVGFLSNIINQSDRINAYQREDIKKQNSNDRSHDKVFAPDKFGLRFNNKNLPKISEKDLETKISNNKRDIYLYNKEGQETDITKRILLGDAVLVHNKNNQATPLSLYCLNPKKSTR